MFGMSGATNQTSCSLGEVTLLSVVPLVITTVVIPLRHESRLLSTMWWLPEKVCMLTAMRCDETKANQNVTTKDRMHTWLLKR